MVEQRADLTFKYNLKAGRHGWLRLTPAYSIKLVEQILEQHPDINYVLDPFSGSGTTGLVCAERGLRCDLLDINPFLVWLARVKTAQYEPEALRDARAAAAEIVRRAAENRAANLWTPPIHNITRWWAEERLTTLAQLHCALNQVLPEPGPIRDLLLLAFCDVLITWSNAAFNHQSMSFKDADGQLSLFDDRQRMLEHFVNAVTRLVESAATPLAGQVRVTQADSRAIPPGGPYDCVITSPPYPNRMSYIRELRPYMYWLGYLSDGRAAGELDWQAIGGTWGIATSRLQTWQPDGVKIPYPEFHALIAAIEQQSLVLAAYVHRYFADMVQHVQSVYDALAPGGRAFYIVGNSRFYETLVPVEEIYAAMIEAVGFERIEVQRLRKRNSKKELFEFQVMGWKPQR